VEANLKSLVSGMTKPGFFYGSLRGEMEVVYEVS
jgi:hypothetical protein